MILTDKHVIDHISDTIIYLRELFNKEKVTIQSNPIRIAFWGRLISVHSFGATEAFVRIVYNKLNGTINKNVEISTLLELPELKSDFESWLVTAAGELSTLDEVIVFMKGLQAMRDLVIHGLTTKSAFKFQEKSESLIKAKLPLDPNVFSLEDVERLLKLDMEMTNLVGAVYAKNNKLLNKNQKR